MGTCPGMPGGAPGGAGAVGVRHPVGVKGRETLGLLGRASRGKVEAGGVAAPSGMLGKGGSGKSSCCAGDILRPKPKDLH